MLPFCRLDWLAEIVLLSIFSAYVFMFGFICYNKSLQNYGEQIMFLSAPVFILSLILLFIVIVNWILRPKHGGGNILEKIRRFLFGNWIKDYDEIVIIKNKDSEYRYAANVCDSLTEDNISQAHHIAFII